MNTPSHPESKNSNPYGRYANLIFLALAIALIVQQVLLWWLYYHGAPKQLIGDEVRYLETARSILAGGAWHPSDIWPPAQPLLIALMFWLSGSAILSVQLLQTVLFFGCGALLWLFWKRFSGNALAAAFAASLFLLNPSNAAYAQYLWPEIPHLFLYLALLYLLQSRPENRLAAFAAGVMLGLALLFKSLLSAFWPLLLLCFIATRKPFRVHWQSAYGFLLGVAAITAPALMAGHQHTGHWSIADSSSINLLIGLNDQARNDYVPGPSDTLFNSYMQSGTTADERNAWAFKEIGETLRHTPATTLLWQQLTRQYFRLFESKTLLLTQLPGPVCAGYWSSYFPISPVMTSGIRLCLHFFHALTLVGFAFGVCLWRDWRKPWLWLLLALVGYQLALYLGLHVKARYVLPIIPIGCGFAGQALAYVFSRDANATVSRWRISLGAILALLLLGLAFAGPWLDGYCKTS